MRGVKSQKTLFMKTKYIVYPILGKLVDLFLNQRGSLSGCVFGQKPDDRGLQIIGEILVFEGGDENPVENIFVCKISTPVNPDNFFDRIANIDNVRSPTGFSIDSPPLEEMSVLQQRALPLAIEGRPFKARFCFTDKKRALLRGEPKVTYPEKDIFS